MNGKTYTQPIVVKPDPRVKTPALAMQQVYSLSKAMYYGALDAQAAARQARDLHEQIVARRRPGQRRGRRVVGLAGREGPGAAGGAAAGPDTLSGASAALAGVMNILQGADVRPTTVQLKAITAARTAAASAMVKWTAIKTVDLPALNGSCVAAGLPPLTF